jgi:hypothetical protein
MKYYDEEKMVEIRKAFEDEVLNLERSGSRRLFRHQE